MKLGKIGKLIFRLTYNTLNYETNSFRNAFNSKYQLYLPAQNA